MLSHEQTAALLEQAETPGARSIALLTIENTRLIGELMIAVQRMVDGQTDHREKLEHIDDRLASHIRDEGSLLTWGMRVFASVSALLAFVVSVGGWYIGHHIIAVNEVQQTAIERHGNRLTAIEAELLVRKTIEAAK